MGDKESAAVTEGRKLQGNRSSVFDLSNLRRPTIVASSVTSFSLDPLDEISKPPAKVQYENTYMMDPPCSFRPGPVTEIIKEIFDQSLAGRSYEPIVCSSLSKSLALDIKNRVKELEFERYKIVVIVSIGQKEDASIRIGSRCVWDPARDSFCSASYESPALYAVGHVYAVYFE